jgi:soluble lytic murein transglycosylase-like protein
VTRGRRPGARAGALARAALACAVALGGLAASRATAEPGLAAPTLAPDGSVRWTARSAAPDSAGRALARALAASRSTADSARAWLAAADADPTLRWVARIEAARAWLAAGDTARADSALQRVTGRMNAWRWPALERRAGIALARGGPATAESLLAHAGAQGFLPGDLAARADAWFDLCLAAGDTAGALRLGRSPERTLHVSRGTDEVLRAQGTTPDPGWEIGTARIEAGAGDAAGASRRLARVLGASAGAPRSQAALALARVEARRQGLESAAWALAEAEQAAPDPAALAHVLVERARIEAEARAPDRAEASYERAATLGDEGGRVEARLGLLALHRWYGRWGEGVAVAESLRAHPVRPDSVLLPLGRGTVPGAFDAGLAELAGGRPEAALELFAQSPGEPGRFWTGVLLRRAGDARGDSLLRRVAAAPGYTFYRVAARETLGVAGWRGGIAVRAEADARVGRAAALLRAFGREKDAQRAIVTSLTLPDTTVPQPPLVSRAGRDEPCEQVDESAGERDDGTWQEDRALASAAAAYAVGSYALAVTRALELAPESADSASWDVVPWLYPPAHDAAFASVPESAGLAQPDRALMRAVAWKESRFDARARSRSDAIGLVQLKVGTAADQARALRERPPGAAGLMEPARNVRYGTFYLGRLWARHGSVHRALGAYNAGPTNLARWLALWEQAPGRESGGVALECELMCRPETATYVKRILALRRAYQELRPALAP